MASYYFFNDGSGDTSWITPNNWWLDDLYTSPVGSFPSLNGDDTVYVYSEVSSDIDNTVVYTLINNSTIYTNSSFGIYNSFTNNGTFTADLDFTVDGPSTFNNNGTAALNGETYLNGTIVNTQSITIQFILIIGGTFNNITSNSELNVFWDSIFNGTMINSGTVNLGSPIINSGTVTNNGLWYIANQFLNRAEFINNGTVTCTQLSVLGIQPNAPITNNGTFNFGTTYTTKVKGPIYPQVPSSISFGGAVVGAIF